MNLQYHFSGPAERYILDKHPSPGLLNGVVDDLLRLLVESKAMALFCMLFAVGLAIQLERKEARGDGGFWAFAWRRMGALMAIGALHVVLLWEGDILITYALAGILLFPYLRRRSSTIYIWVAALFGLMAAWVVAMAVMKGLAGPVNVDAQRARMLARIAPFIAQSLEAHAQTNWWDMLLYRLQQWYEHAGMIVPALLESFLNALLGLAVWRSGVLKDPAAHLPALRRAARWLTGAGLSASVVALYWKPIRAFAGAHPPWGVAISAPAALLTEFAAPVLALAYGALLLLAWQRPAGQTLLRPFSWPGRMALTNYLAQSLIMTAIFYGWGLGLFGKVPPALALALGLAVFAVQILYSRWWLGRFQFGPAEWLWRCASYARRQPFRIRRPAPATVS
jgi:uncharacterized protein